jgi:hypothetical protein
MISLLKREGFLSLLNEDGYTPLQEAAISGELDIAKELVDEGVDVNVQSSEGQTALTKAAEFEHYDIVMFLLNNGATHQACEEGNTPLHETLSASIAELLILYGANVNAVNLNMETPLHDASHNEAVDVMKCLLSMGANIEAVCEYGTALEMAIENGRLKSVELLLEYGADCSQKDASFELLKERIDESKEDRFSKDVYEKMVQMIDDAVFTRTKAIEGDATYFINRMRSGLPFHVMQVLPNLRTPISRMKLIQWVHGMKIDASMMNAVFQHCESTMFSIGPIVETIKSMVLLPEKTRCMLNDVAFYKKNIVGTLHCCRTDGPV